MLAPFTTSAFKKELLRILDYWETYAPDTQRGGFHGRVSYENKPVPDAPRSVVVTARILWTFSMANRLLHKRRYLAHAQSAYNYLERYFLDRGQGGVYWSVTADGQPLDARKQIYGQSFAIYGLSEYYRATKYPPALALAKGLFEKIEKHAYDPERQGYLEAFAPDWSETDDLILSKKPWVKSMNTHLHLIEAYTNLYRVWPTDLLRQRITSMLDAILTHIVRADSHRMQLFFTKNWEPKDDIISYGHDIEASWLLYETAEVLHDPTLLARLRERAVRMAEAAATGLGADGALHYEYDPATQHTNTDRSWWVLAEQMVGFYNAYQLSGQAHFRDKAEGTWRYIQEKFVDNEKGEWYGTVKEDGTPLKNDKIHFWKGPYHNARACAEMWHRLGRK
ncbi:cellobiose 2-epimerase [Rhabdobacter roseus]|uniref:Cellobiose 2-epimerase n=1 Tax=Rhabdobacter roseus TaxID=1655419 RepID=A0A840U2M7_9BACT|nr:AGE family epimerase/isomerase [Rhabdobacter roseus]MBB5286608.1 mannobiose 2-epimerase [Rhabdobacter roseus]